MTQDELLRKLEELVARWQEAAGPVNWWTPIDLRRACANALEKLIGEYHSPISEAKADDG